MAWRPAPLPADEPQRQAALRDLGWFAPQAEGLSEAAPVDALRALADAARQLCGCPVGLVTLVDAEHGCQVGVDGAGPAHDDASGDAQPRLHVAPRAQLICAHAVAANDYLEVPDILLDARFAGAIDHPASEGWRFYAAMPLRLNGHAVGTLSVAAARPHRLEPAQRRQLAQLALAAEALLATRHASAALARERQRLADLARASGDWLWELDERLHHRWLSDDAERVTGLPLAALIGRPLADEPCVDALGDPLPSGTSLRTRLSEGVPIARVVTRLDTPRRGRLYVSRSAVPVLDAQGRVVGWRGSARDVTSQVLAARETRERDQRMHKLLSQVPGAAFQLRLDAGGTRPHYLFANEGLRELIGDAEGPGLPTLRRVLPEDRARVADAILAAIAALEPLRIEYRLQRGDGSVRWLETRAAPERQSDGSVVFHGFTWDVTERHLAQEALREHEALRLARESAERASRAKSEFLSRVSHELRTPLNAILGFAQLMGLDREQPLSSTQRQRLDGVRQAGQSLLALIDDVLDVSRLEQGAIALRSDAVALSTVVRRAADAVQPLAVARAVQLKLADTSGCWVQADAGALEHVLVNLLSNAIKFNRAGGRVRVDAEPSDEATMMIHVQDDGEGLRPDQISQLFQPFSRLGAQRRRISGSGLGLVIARGLARAMGGDVLVQSEPGRGSRFSVRLAMAAAGAGVDAGPGEAPGPGGGAGAATPGRGVLYIEDEPLNVLLMEEVFRTQPGWTLHVAHDGASGVELASRIQPDLALIDMNLPDMNGLEVLRRLRADPSTAGLLCVALSADAMSEQIAAARAAGFDDYWTKPIDLTRLLDSVRRVIDERGGRPA